MITANQVRSIAITLDDGEFQTVVAQPEPQEIGEYLKQLLTLHPSGVPLYFRSTSGAPKPPRVARLDFRSDKFIAREIPQ
jgi:hypothetical protein